MGSGRTLPACARVALLLLGGCTSHSDAAPSTPTASATPAIPSPSVSASAPPTQPPVAPAPKVDLASDVATRLEAAHTRFGATARTHLTGNTFLLVEPGPKSPLFDQAGSLLDRAFPALQSHFPHRPDAGVTVLAFTSASAYSAYVTDTYGPEAAGDYGVYRPSFREIAADASGGVAYLPTLTHEIVHPLMAEDFPKAPLWFAEGVASVFEAPRFSTDGSIHGENRNWRHDRLQAAFASKTERDEARLDTLFAMTSHRFNGKPPHSDISDSDKALLHYAMARSVCVWLDSQGKLWPLYEAWRDGVAEDRLGLKAFEKVMGATPTALNDAWVRWGR